MNFHDPAAGKVSDTCQFHIIRTHILICAFFRIHILNIIIPSLIQLLAAKHDCGCFFLHFIVGCQHNIRRCYQTVVTQVNLIDCERNRHIPGIIPFSFYGNCGCSVNRASIIGFHIIFICNGIIRSGPQSPGPVINTDIRFNSFPRICIAVLLNTGCPYSIRDASLRHIMIQYPFRIGDRRHFEAPHIASFVRDQPDHDSITRNLDRFSRKLRTGVSANPLIITVIYVDEIIVFFYFGHLVKGNLKFLCTLLSINPDIPAIRQIIMWTLHLLRTRTNVTIIRHCHIASCLFSAAVLRCCSNNRTSFAAGCHLSVLVYDSNRFI